MSKSYWMKEQKGNFSKGILELKGGEKNGQLFEERYI